MENRFGTRADKQKKSPRRGRREGESVLTNGERGGRIEGQEQGPSALHPSLAAVLDWLQLGFVGFVLVLCLRARGRHGDWLALSLFLPLVRLALNAAYRRRVSLWARRLLQSLPADLSRYDRVPWLAALVFVVLPSAILFLANSRNMGVSDTWPVIPTACSLVTEGTLDLDDQIAAALPVYTLVSATDVPCCTIRVGGHIISGYPSGMVSFALPVVALARLVGADLHSPRTHERLEKFTAAWVAAGSVGLFFLLALHLTKPTPALVSTLLLAVGSALFSTCGQALWQQGGVIFWMLVVLFLEFRRSVRPVRGGTWLQGVACAMMLACRLSASLLVVSFGAWVLVREPRRAVRVGLAAAVAFIPWAILHASLYGTPLGPSVGLLAREAWFGTVSEGLKGVLFSPARGLFVYQPWLLVGLTFSLFLWMRPPLSRSGASRLGMVLPDRDVFAPGPRRFLGLLVGRPLLGLSTGSGSRALAGTALRTGGSATDERTGRSSCSRVVGGAQLCVARPGCLPARRLLEQLC